MNDSPSFQNNEKNNMQRRINNTLFFNTLENGKQVGEEREAVGEWELIKG